MLAGHFELPETVQKALYMHLRHMFADQGSLHLAGDKTK